jgi:hypothetical protein
VVARGSRCPNSHVVVAGTACSRYGPPAAINRTSTGGRKP